MRKIERFDKYMNINKLNDNQVTVNCGLSVGLLGKARRGDSDLGDKSIGLIIVRQVRKNNNKRLKQQKEQKQ